MPVRAKFKPQLAEDIPSRSPSPYGAPRTRYLGAQLPAISADDNFRHVVKKLAWYFSEVIVLPSSFEQLRTTSAGDGIRVLVEHLIQHCTHPAIINALLALKWHYAAMFEDKGLNDARANACEIVAWRFLVHLSEREAMDYCLYEIPNPKANRSHQGTDAANGGGGGGGGQQSAAEEGAVDENSALLAQFWAGSLRGSAASRPSSRRKHHLMQSISRLTMNFPSDVGEADGGEGGTGRQAGDADDDTDGEDLMMPFVQLNALEIAAIADAKRFLSQNVVQKIITGIWNGDIIFWDSLSAYSVKKPRFYNPRTADSFSRLRVPKYLKSFEVLFFLVFLVLYYSVLVERDPQRITTVEGFLYLWLAAFLYDEMSEWMDAGSVFYAADVWNLFDMIMIVIGVIFATLRITGLYTHNEWLVEFSFDFLALEALFMVPRVCSILSLSPYWGTLIPCLRAMLQDFVKFMVFVVILYLGFLTTFSLIGRDRFSLPNMTMILTKIFFGSSYVGFDIMEEIDPFWGPPLMIIFVTLSSILLMGSLTGMLSNSFSRVITHAKEEYLYVYSIYVLEASTSNRLTHFYPPFNLIALVIFRPLRLFLPSDTKFRAARILLLKATHLPIVGAIQLYEFCRAYFAPQAAYRAGRNGRTNAFAPPHSAGLGTGGGIDRRPISSGMDTMLNSRKRPAGTASDRAAAGGSGGGYGSNSNNSNNNNNFLGVPPKRQQPQRRPNIADAFVSPLLLLSAGQQASAADDEDESVPGSDAEVRLEDLAAKMDRLTELVVRLQDQVAGLQEQQHMKSLTGVEVPLS